LILRKLTKARMLNAGNFSSTSAVVFSKHIFCLRVPVLFILSVISCISGLLFFISLHMASIFLATERSSSPSICVTAAVAAYKQIAICIQIFLVRHFLQLLNTCNISNKSCHNKIYFTLCYKDKHVYL
jgi:hypothetical protein